MILAQIDAAIRAGAVAAMLMLAWLLLIRRREAGRPALLFAPMAVCLSGFVIGNTPFAALRPSGPLGEVAHVAAGFTVVFLWWFCLSCFDRRFALRGGVLWVGLLWALIAALDRGLAGPAAAAWGWSRLLVPIGFGIVGHIVWRLLDERRGDLIAARREARVRVALMLGGLLAVDLAADALFGFAWRPVAFAMAQNVAALAFALWLAGRLLVVRPDVLTFRTAEPPSVAAPDPDSALARRLVALMDGERLFLDPALDLAGFVARMGAPEKKVRALINRELGHDHFRSFLNQYRVAEAKRRLRDPAHAGDKLIAVALDSGFASLASFNRAFRALEGCSPGAWRDRPAFEERKDGF